MFFNRFLNIVHLNTALQRVQLRHLQRFGAHVQPGDRRAFARHTFGEDTAAAADIEGFFTEQAAGAFGDIAQPQRVNAVERFELALQIPPA